MALGSPRPKGSSGLGALSDFDAVVDFFVILGVEYPGQWKNLIKLFLRKAAKKPSEPHVPAAPSQAALFDCRFCDKQFASIHAVLQHERVKHGVRAEERNYVVGDFCPVRGTC